MAPWADILYFCDPTWWEWHKDMEFKGRIITQDQGIADKYDLEYIESRAENGLSTNPSYIHQGANSGYQAINLAYHYGAKRIILLGFDMKPTGGKKHWFGEHPNNSESNYQTLIQNFAYIPPQLPNLGLKIINCTRSTALNCFQTDLLENIL